MKNKRVLRFYFSADRLNRALDKIISANAMNYSGNAVELAEKIIDVIEIKKSLSALWRRVDGVVSEFGEEERELLRFYGFMRLPYKELDGAFIRELRRVIVKFARKSKRISFHKEELTALDGCYALV